MVDSDQSCSYAKERKKMFINKPATITGNIKQCLTIRSPCVFNMSIKLLTV